MFQLIVDGRIGADAEKKITPNGREYITFRMAHNDKDKAGNQQTIWFSVTSWNQLGLAQFLTKGKAINVIGKPSFRLYETRDGKNEIGYDITATSIEFPSFGTGEGNATSKTVVANTAPSQEQAPEPAPLEKPTTAEIGDKVQTATNDADDELPF